MRPTEFTSEQIIQAGQELLDSGRNITGFALRNKVGGGNPNRLKQVWDEYVSRQSVTKTEPVAELPVEVADEVAAVTKALTDRLANLAVELNDKAVKAAERRVAEVVRAAGEQREQAERELADASQTVDDLETKLDQAEGDAAALAAKYAELQAASQAQAIELAQARERLAVIVQESKTARDEHTAELYRLNAGIEGERSRHQNEIAQIRTELAEQKKTLAAANAERERLRAELATVTAKSETADQANQERRKQAEAEALRVAERMAKAERERDEAREAAAAAREDVAALRGQLEAIATQNAALMAALKPSGGGKRSTKE